MRSIDDQTLVLLVLSAAHLGFQLTVTGVVYPALARVSQADWPVAHAGHSRRIAWVVMPIYAALVGVIVWLLVTGPSGWQIVSILGALLSLLTTALFAAPLHGKLTPGPEPALVHRLLVIDRVRCVGAVICFVGALAAAY